MYQSIALNTHRPICVKIYMVIFSYCTFTILFSLHYLPHLFYLHCSPHFMSFILYDKLFSFPLLIILFSVTFYYSGRELSFFAFLFLPPFSFMLSHLPSIPSHPSLSLTSSYSVVLASGQGEVVLTVESASTADTGVYLCHAANIIGAIHPAFTALVVTRKFCLFYLLYLYTEEWNCTGTNRSSRSSEIEKLP